MALSGISLSPQIEKLMALHNLAIEDARKYEKKRFVYEEIKTALASRAYVGLAGLRGAGKTVLLRQLAAQTPSSFYVSADTLEPGIGIFELAQELAANYKKRLILIDEIHFCKNWQAELKKAYDFLGIKIAFTSSASIEIIGSAHDLSRRVVIIPIPAFSFREYIYFKKGILEEQLSLERITSNYKEIYPKLSKHAPDFLEFCTRGALAACLDTPSPQILRSISDKIINRDLLAFGKLEQADLLNIQALLRFVSRSGVDVCSYSSIAKNTGITKYKAQAYLSLLEKAFLTKIILPYGTNTTKEPKILCSLPFRPHFAEGADEARLIGALREEFFIHHVHNASLVVNYLKSTRGEKLADYIVFCKGRRFIFEIGGAGKSNSQFKGAPSGAHFVLTQPANPRKGIPLLLFGFIC